VPNVLIVAALQLRHPMPLLVQMKADDAALNSHFSRSLPFSR
jgi:hypothetical protein